MMNSIYFKKDQQSESTLINPDLKLKKQDFVPKRGKNFKSIKKS